MKLLNLLSFASQSFDDVGCAPKTQEIKLIKKLLLLLLLRSNPSRQHSKVLYRCRVRRRGKTGNHGKVGLKRKWWVLVQSPYSRQGNERQSPRVEPWG